MSELKIVHDMYGDLLRNPKSIKARKCPLTNYLSYLLTFYYNMI